MSETTPATPPARHPRLDAGHWLRTIPEQDARPAGDSIDGPRDWVRVERARERVRAAYDLGTPVAVDLILWAAGPAAGPHLTRTGGVPHREAGRPWPTNDAGTPLTFLAQFGFLDSGEVAAGPRGGDVLLIFSDGEYGWSDRPGGVVTEWSALALARPATAADVPAPADPGPPPVPEYSAVLHRTVQYPDGRDAVRAWFASPAGRPFTPTTEGLVSEMQASVIGRSAQPIQDLPPGRLLCTLDAIRPGGPWPLVDRDRLTDEDRPRSEWFDFGDDGCLYFFLEDDGTVRWDMTCY